MEQTITINSLPAITWNRMNLNHVAVTLPELGALTPELKADRVSAAPAIATGAGENADCLFAGKPVYAVSAAPGETRESITVIAADDGACTLSYTAEEGSDLTAYVRVKGATLGQQALRLLLDLKKDSKLRLIELLEPGEQGQLLHDVGGSLGENAQVQVLHLYLGRGDLISGCRMDLVGDGSAFTYEAGYLEQGSQNLDVNLIANHIGKKTTCNLRADGTLKGAARKTFRGTIDFKRGCKGSVGAEVENVLLLGDDVQNKTVPLILCAEEDVQGDHGASIGELDQDALFFFAARGMDPETAENLLTREKLSRLSQAMGRADMVSAAEQAIEEVL